MKLRISPELSLPPDAVSRTFGILAQRGAGKSNAAVVMAEEMYRAGLHWVAIDPKGDWWGVRSSGDGKGPGLPVVIFGGGKGDVALDPTAGPKLADVIVGEGITCVLDVSEFTEAEKIRFLAGHGREEGFAGRLFRKKNRDQDPTHLFLEEAHDYIPQRPFKDQAKLVHVFGKLVAMGRTRGLGATLISQRSARLHKDVLTQVDTLVVLRTVGPQDRKAIAAWLEDHGQAKEILESLPGLADGAAWVWSPEWLGQTKRIRFRRRATYDSGATPTVGRAQRRPATLADVDLVAIEKQMEEAVARAKAEDPKELRRNIQNLQARIRELETAGPTSVETVVERVEVPVPVFSDGEVEYLGDTVGGLNAIAGLLGKEGARLSDVSSVLGTAAVKIERALENWTKRTPTGPPTGVAHHAGVRAPARPRASVEGAGRGGPTERKTAGGSARDRPPPPDSSRIAGEDELTGPARKILDSIAWWEMVGYPKPTKQQVGIIAGYRVGKRVGGHYGNTLGALRSAGLIDYPDAGRVVLTEEGRQYADVADLAPSTASLQSAVFARLSEPEGRILKVLVDVYPETLPKQELGAEAGYEVGDRVGGHFGNLLGRLRTLGLIDYPSPGTAAADRVLFLEER